MQLVILWLVSDSDTTMNRNLKSSLKPLNLLIGVLQHPGVRVQEIFTLTRNQAAAISTFEEELITLLIIEDTKSMEDTEKFKETICK